MDYLEDRYNENIVNIYVVRFYPKEMHKPRGKTTRSLGTALPTQPIPIGEESVDSTRSS